jgi:hypothetical protein
MRPYCCGISAARPGADLGQDGQGTLWDGGRLNCKEEPEMPKENDLEGQQDQGGKHGGQAGMPKPEQAAPPVRKPDSQDHKGEVVGDPRVRPTATRSK